MDISNLHLAIDFIYAGFFSFFGGLIGGFTSLANPG
jgi:hypothetical protein